MGKRLKRVERAVDSKIGPRRYPRIVEFCAVGAFLFGVLAPGWLKLIGLAPMLLGIWVHRGEAVPMAERRFSCRGRYYDQLGNELVATDQDV